MEFDELKKIWDAQTNQPLYVIDERALQNIIQSKMRGALRIANFMEWGSIVSNLSAASVLIAVNSLQHGANIFMYIEAVYMLFFVLYIVAHRSRRISASCRFDRSIHGDLGDAISIATYQVHLLRIINWNLLPMGVLALFTGWEAGKLQITCVVILSAFPFLLYGGIKQNRRNARKRRELWVLKEKLEADC